MPTTNRWYLPLLGSAAAGAGLAVLLLRRRKRQRPPAPAWFAALDAATAVRLPEWDNGTAWRAANEFMGTDYSHGPEAAVHVAGYHLDTCDTGARLTGAVHFGPGAESHRGLCHGGSMCTVMDDVLGWTGFCATGRCVPWCGFTVQVNTKLQAPVKVGSWLRVEGRVTSVDGRKVRVAAKLVSPAADGGEVVHCEAEGLCIMKK